ncbi:hypothetical protein BZG36_01576 [Bifiguratus adelaidae]|uniref:HMG box domain-containing protein n=1 Tax=Bifiguratus adelaidae TaxID=1938954 RepID=A0A261Y402_9FUNG|nr:hypothetical protein BZG36_01576 [Bifiguratus adelaidae]
MFGNQSKSTQGNNDGAEVSSSSRKLSNRPERLVRPPNAFILFNKELRNKLKQANPHMQVAEISKAIGGQWRALDDSERQKYVEAARDIKAALKDKHPNSMYIRRSKSDIADTGQLWLPKNRHVDANDTDDPTSATAFPSTLRVSHTRINGQKASLKGQKKRYDKNPQAPRHPLSGYMFYLKEARRDAMHEHPGSTVGAISKIIAEQWKNMTSVQRSPWNRKAEEDKARYAREMKQFAALGIAPLGRGIRHKYKPSDATHKATSAEASNTSVATSPAKEVPNSIVFVPETMNHATMPMKRKSAPSVQTRKWTNPMPTFNDTEVTPKRTKSVHVRSATQRTMLAQNTHMTYNASQTPFPPGEYDQMQPGTTNYINQMMYDKDKYTITPSDHLCMPLQASSQNMLFIPGCRQDQPLAPSSHLGSTTPAFSGHVPRHQPLGGTNSYTSLSTSPYSFLNMSNSTLEPRLALPYPSTMDKYPYVSTAPPNIMPSNAKPHMVYPVYHPQPASQTPFPTNAPYSAYPLPYPAEPSLPSSQYMHETGLLDGQTNFPVPGP